MPLQKTASTADILVTGANGALGRTLIQLLGPKRAVAGTRHQDWDSGLFEHVSLVDDEAINAIDWERFRAVINVAGQVLGNMQELADANVSFPLKLALAARAGNVSQFVQVSSFSVYGSVNYIDTDTPELPINAYGQTKAEGDQKLSVLATDEFRVASLRLPFLFDEDRPALFRQLFQYIKLLPFFPVASDPTKRSMISYADAARALSVIVTSSRSGILHAAAPTLFDFGMLARLLHEEAGFRLRTVPLPNAVVGLTRFATPTIHRRLFQSSVLSTRLNIANDIAEIVDVETPLRALIHKHFV